MGCSSLKYRKGSEAMSGRIINILFILIFAALVEIAVGSAQYPSTGEYLNYQEFEQYLRDINHEWPEGSVVPVVPREALPPPQPGVPTGHVNNLPYEQYLVYVYPGVTQISTYTGPYDLCSFCHVNGYHLPTGQLQLTPYGATFADQPEHIIDPVTVLQNIGAPEGVSPVAQQQPLNDWCKSPLSPPTETCAPLTITGPPVTTMGSTYYYNTPDFAYPAHYKAPEAERAEAIETPIVAGITGAQNYISSCTAISSPGKYMLNTNITNSPSPICIYINSSDVILDGAEHIIGGIGALGTAGIYVNNPAIVLTNVTVKNLTVAGWHFGIFYNTTINGSMDNNAVILTGTGISLKSSSNTIVSNNFVNNIAGLSNLGIALVGSNNSNVTNNMILNNSYGIGLAYSSKNTLTDNIAGLNELGIALIDSNNSYVTNNGVLVNIYGIRLANSSNNTIYNNYFNNIINTIFAGTIYSSYWNTTKTNATNIIKGPSLGGNYWANLKDTGFSQTCTDVDNDGICDSSYQLNSSNIDYLPLRK